jgi:hypothetical protein
VTTLMWSGKGGKGLGVRELAPALVAASWLAAVVGRVLRRAVRETRGERGKLPLPSTRGIWAGNENGSRLPLATIDKD